MRISKELVKHVQQVIEKTGFIPNRAAASLRTGKTFVIGLIVEDIAGSFFAALAKSIESFASMAGYRVIYGSTENNDKRGIELIQLLLKQVDGFLIVPSNGMRTELSKLAKQKKPLVLIDRYFPEEKIPYVLADGYAGIANAVGHLIENKKKNIAFVTVDLDQIQLTERERAFEETLKKQKQLQKKLVLKLPYNANKSAYSEGIRTFLQKNPQVDAVIFATNYLGTYGLKAIRELDLSIPEDIAVISFDDTDLFRFSSPAITVINQPVQEIAEQAVRLLLKQFEDRKTQTKINGVWVLPELIQRQSV